MLRSRSSPDAQEQEQPRWAGAGRHRMPCLHRTPRRQSPARLQPSPAAAQPGFSSALGSSQCSMPVQVPLPPLILPCGCSMCGSPVELGLLLDPLLFGGQLLLVRRTRPALPQSSTRLICSISRAFCAPLFPEQAPSIAYPHDLKFTCQVSRTFSLSFFISSSMKFFCPPSTSSTSGL